MSAPRLVAIAYRKPASNIAAAAAHQFWGLPWVQQHVHVWHVFGDYALCATCPSAVGVVDSRDADPEMAP